MTETPAYRHSRIIRMADTDAGGVVFFARQFDIAHEAFEAMFAAAGLGLADIVASSAIILPIVHAESAYSRPLHLGDELTVDVVVERLGDTSFTLAYTLYRGETVVGSASTTHVAVDRASRKPIRVPDDVRAVLGA